MGTLTPIQLGTRSNPSRHSKQAGNARLINCFSEALGTEGKAQYAITGSPGLALFGSALGTGPIRNMIVVSSTLMLVVSGRQVYSVNASGVGTLIGGIPTDGPVYSRINRRAAPQVAFDSDGYYTVWDAGTLTQVQDPDLPPPTSLAFLNGYGILPGANGNFMITGIDDFTTIDGLDEGAARTSPGEIVRAYELDREIYFFKGESTEAHQDNGDADFPLALSQTMTVGTSAADSVCAVDTPTGKALAFVAHDHTVRVMSGYQPQIVSNGEIEGLISKLAEAGTIGTLKATSRSWGGRNFYSLSCADWTRELDTKTGNWCDRNSYGSKRWRVSKTVSFAGKQIAGDATTGQLYQVNDDVYAEGTDPLVMQIIPPTIHAFPARGRINAIYLDAAAGVGLNTDAPQDKDPVIIFDYSKDGGETWSVPRNIALGRLGQNAKRLQPLTRLGKFGQKGFTPRFTISAGCKRVVLSAYADIDQLQTGAAA